MIDPSKPIAVVATSGAYNLERYQAGIDLLESRGFRTEQVGPLRPQRYLAASDEIRSVALRTALTQDRFSAVWLARGGYGFTRILDDLDLSDVAGIPMIGFSDMTAAFAPLEAAGVPVIHGPVVHSLGVTDEASLDHLWALLAGERTAPLQGKTWVEGTVTAPLRGGNLCMLASVCGTQAQPDLSGSILLLEEVGEVPYRIDRMLQQCKSSGLFDDLVGVAVGQFTSCRLPEGADYTIEDILMEFFEPLGVPVVGDLPIGHGPQNHAVVIGRPVTLADACLDLHPEAGPAA